MMVVGLFMAITGNRFVEIVIGLVASAAVFLVLTYISFALFMGSVQAKWAQWTVIGVCGLIGLICGVLLAKFKKFGFAIMSGFSGAMLGAFITMTFAVKTNLAYWLILCGLGASFAIISWFIEEYVIMFVTAFIGSYSFFRGLSFYAGGFPNEMELHKKLSSGALDWADFNKWFYAYVGGIVVMFIASFVYQWKVKSANDMKNTL